MVLRRVAVDGELPDGAAVRILADLLKAEAVEKAADHVVFGRRVIVAADRLDAGFAAALDEAVEHRELHVALQNAAAHQPQLDVERFAVLFADHDGDDAVVAELVDQLAVQADVVGAFEGRLHLGRRVALRRHVELVALVRELGDARDVDRQEVVDHGVHLKAPQIVAVVAEGGHLRGAQRVLLVHLVALEVVLAEGRHLEEAAAVDRRDVILDAVHLRHGRALDLRADDLALGGVVVGEDDRVGQDVELGGRLGDVAVLVLPVRLDDDEVVRLQRALGVVEAGDRVFTVVFGADRQHDADGLELLDITLELIVRLGNAGLLADLDAVHAVVADNAAPERVVEVERERLLVLAEDRLDDVRDAEGEGRDRLEAHRVFVHVPEQRVRPFLQAVVGGNVVEIVDVEALVFARERVERVVQAGEEVRPAVYVPRVAVAEQAVKRHLEVVLDDRAVEFLLDAPPHRRELFGFDAELCVDRLGRVGHFRPVRDVAVRGVDENDVRLKAAQRLVREHGVLKILRVLRFVEGRFNAGVQQEELQRFDDVARRGAAEHGDALLDARRAVCEQRPADGPALLDDMGSVERVFEFGHGQSSFLMRAAAQASGEGLGVGVAVAVTAAAPVGCSSVIVLSAS